jgi:hypothetical protein
MQLLGSGEGGDVLAVLQAQPSLLVQQDGPSGDQVGADCLAIGLPRPMEAVAAARSQAANSAITAHAPCAPG